VPVGSKYEMICENGHRLSVNRESRKYNIKERSDNIQLAFRNALYLAYMRGGVSQGLLARYASFLRACTYLQNPARSVLFSGFRS
jgi:hypothetical protein